MLHYSPFIEEPESLGKSTTSRVDIGQDCRAAQPFKGFSQPSVAIPANLPVSGYKEVMGFESDSAIFGISPASIEPLHKLANRKDQNVLIVLCCSSKDRGNDSDIGLSIFAAPLPYACIQFGRKRENRCLKTIAVALERKVEHVCEEELTDCIALRGRLDGAFVRFPLGYVLSLYWRNDFFAS